MDSNRLVSDAIKVRLVRIHKTQQDVCAELGVDEMVMSRRMTGKSGWTIDLLDRIAKPLGFAGAVEIISAAQAEKQTQSLAA